MTKKRRIKNLFRSGSTWFASLLVTFVLLAVISYIFASGWSTFDISMFSGNYYASNILAKADEDVGAVSAV